MNHTHTVFTVPFKMECGTQRTIMTNDSGTIIVIIIIVVIIIITFMHGINNYIPETNHVSMVHSVAAIL